MRYVIISGIKVLSWLELESRYGKAISQYQRYHNALCFPSKYVFIFSWYLQWSPEKMETMLMQDFGGNNEEYCAIFETV